MQEHDNVHVGGAFYKYIFAPIATETSYHAGMLGIYRIQMLFIGFNRILR